MTTNSKRLSALEPVIARHAPSRGAVTDIDRLFEAYEVGIYEPEHIVTNESLYRSAFEAVITHVGARAVDLNRDGKLRNYDNQVNRVMRMLAIPPDEPVPSELLDLIEEDAAIPFTAYGVATTWFERRRAYEELCIRSTTVTALRDHAVEIRRVIHATTCFDELQELAHAVVMTAMKDPQMEAMWVEWKESVGQFAIGPRRSFR